MSEMTDSMAVGRETWYQFHLLLWWLSITRWNEITLCSIWWLYLIFLLISRYWFLMDCLRVHSFLHTISRFATRLSLPYKTIRSYCLFCGSMYLYVLPTYQQISSWTFHSLQIYCGMCLAGTLFSRGNNSIVYHFRKNDLMPVIICKYDNHFIM